MNHVLCLRQLLCEKAFIILHIRGLGDALPALRHVGQQLILYRKEGFSGYLPKPISGALLEAAVLSILPKELVAAPSCGKSG